jgi:hypothetical protein
MKPFLVAAAGVLLAFLGSQAPALAADKQGGSSFSSSPSQGSSKTRSSAPARSGAISGCVSVSARINKTKSNGKTWDTKGKRVAPDPFLTDLASRKNLKTCKDSFSCRWTLHGKSGSISIRIMDRDIAAHDLIGQGKCSLSSRSCRLGQARITLRGC